MHWLALYCPTLPLDCILRRWPARLEPALAVTDLDGSRRLIAVATRLAEAGGVFAGQSIATALALLPDLILVAREPENERSALAEAALAVLRFTPTVSLRASGMLLEISASLKLFGGRRLLKKEVLDTMKMQGLAVAAAEAPTPHGAWLMAQERSARERIERDRQPADARPQKGRSSRTGTSKRPGFQEALNALPIAHLDHGRPLLRRLDGIGCTTLADLRRLPVHGLARRFGPALIDELARAAGDKPDPQTVFEAPSRFATRMELMARVDSAEALVFAANRLLAQLAGWLAARRAAVRGFSLVLHHERWSRDAIEPTSIPIALATPTRELDRLVTLVRERLSRLELKAPVLELALDVPVVVDEEEAPGRLFAERDQTTQTLARLLEKLVARLGHEALARIERVADHRPERAWRTLRGDLLDGSNAASRPRSQTRHHPQSYENGSRRVDSVASRPLESILRPSVAAVVDIQEADITDSVRSSLPTLPARAAASASTALSKAPSTADPMQPLTADPTTPCGPRPAWLLAEPTALEVRLHRPCFESLPLDLVAGPERIETGWWDDAPATRDYFIAENAAGHLVWIYCERLPVAGRPQWYLQGLFG